MKHASTGTLKTLRKERDFDQTDVAQCVGIHPSSLARIERGEQEPTLSDICALLVTFQSDFNAIFGADLELAKADIFARIAEHRPDESKTPKSAKRVESFRALIAFLNKPHGAHC